jgi:hypothetical protein
MKPRQYELELPYTIPSMFVGMAVTKFKQHEGWNNLPFALIQKINKAEDGWTDLILTQEDLDSIPTKLWASIASELNINWK